jgi:hypothetical protein
MNENRAHETTDARILAMAAEIWLHGFPLPRRTVDLAVQAERWGFDELLLADSENLVGDLYVLARLGPSPIRRSACIPGPGGKVTLTRVLPGAAQRRCRPGPGPARRCRRETLRARPRTPPPLP